MQKEISLFQENRLMINHKKLKKEQRKHKTNLQINEKQKHDVLRFTSNNKGHKQQHGIIKIN